MNTEKTGINGTAALSNGQRKIIVIDPRQPEARKLRVAAYARVSSDSADQLNSYISQVKYYTGLIQENEAWDYVDIYADEGLTGLSADKREDFQRMLSDCRKGKIDRILVKSVSRFSRNTTDCIRTVHELQKLGVTIFFEKENIDTANLSSEFFLSFHGTRAQRESTSISGNMRYGCRMRMKNGTFIPSSTPYGYILKDRELTIEPTQAEVVKRIFESYLTGMGMASIADELNAAAIPRKYGRSRWYHTTIFYILTNIAYVGDAIWQKSYTTDTLPFKKMINHGEKDRYYVSDSHDRIIDRKDFDTVQDLLAVRKTTYRSGQEPGQYLLGKKVFCGECGTLFRRKVCSDKIYWVCRRHNAKKAECSVPQIPESELYEAFIRLYNKFRNNRNSILAPMLEQLRAVTDRRYRSNNKMCELNKEIAELSEQILILNRLKSKGYIESALYFTQVQEINHKIKTLRSVKRKIMESDEADSVIEATEQLLDLLDDSPEWLDEMDAELFEDMVERITVESPERIKIRLCNGLELAETIKRTVR